MACDEEGFGELVLVVDECLTNHFKLLDMKINFRKIEAQTSFEGSIQTFDTAETVGNEMMYNGSILLDIGFEELAKEIYYSTDAVEVPERYCKALELVVKNSRLIAAVKRAIINRLNPANP